MDPSVSEKFYHTVIQVVLLFGVDNMGLLRKVMSTKAKMLKDGSWQKVESYRVIQGAGIQPIQTYIDRRQGTVVEWVALRPILEVCTNETDCEGGGRLREPWWCQAAS